MSYSNSQVARNLFLKELLKAEVDVNGPKRTKPDLAVPALSLKFLIF